MKILVTTGPAHPLYYPIVPLAWALRAAGHDVLVGAPESFAETVRGSGLPMAAVCGPLQMPEAMARHRDGTPITPPRTDHEATVAVGHGFGRLAARALEGTTDLVERWQPDVVLAEAYSYAAAAAVAAKNGIGWVKHSVGPGDLDIDTWVAEELAPELAQLGLDRLPSPDLVLDNCPPLLGEAFPGAQPMRYVPYGEPGLVPGWALRRDRNRPRVLVTLGSVQPMAGGLGALGELVRSVSSLDVEIVVAVADVLVPKLGPLPDSVIAAGWQSLTSVLPGCDAVVHHGGPGTMMACLCEGLPQVIIPGIGKPLDAIARLVDFGAACQVAPDELSRVPKACQALLDEPGYRRQAAIVRDQIAAQPSPAEIVAAIEQVGARRKPAW
ncbi:nucleotide disphospho-sugar-binding domain-containing protein [Nonomuraea sp. NPDC046570]|uniref:nucleotide disphospho-sugar-binding domain-containing protein n=1 Tax=Nonomuraea sp. NPDC046570 TaxID=3155255 RepID=UPI0033EC8A5D